VKTLPRPRAAPGRGAGAYPQPDLVLGRYRLLEQIGSGGYGTVWIARDQERRQRVAVKRIARDHADPQARARVEREARAAARLAHPAIVKLHETGSDAGADYLISELVEGSSLAALYHSGGVGDRELLAIGSVLSDALEHAHRCGVVHRDVKPQNVIVPARVSAGDAPAKLTDFGIARLAGEHPLTSTGEVIGTFEYMAPEQAEGRTAGPQADLYSLALTLYEGFAGANPLRGATVAATALRVGTVIAPLRHVRGDLPPALCSAIDRALAPEPASRGNLTQLREALDGALALSQRRRALGTYRGVWRSGGAQSAPMTLTPRARRLSSAALAGAVSGLTVTTVLGSYRPDVGVFAGLGAAALVCLSVSVGWLLLGLAALGWLGASGQPGVALVLCAALAPVPVLLPSRPWLWSVPALAPALGALGVGACAPVFAGRLAGRAPSRAALGALSYWWLALAETLVGRRLLLGAAAGVQPRSDWRASLGGAFQHALAPLWSDGRLLTAALWALAAVVLPWVVRGRSAELRALGALIWAGSLMVAGVALAARLGSARPPAPLAAGALAAALAFVTANVRADSHQSPSVA
jgi:hypothetical protein